MRDDRAVVIGAGMGGLAAAIDLATAGYAVTLLERAAAAGGKMREVEVGGAPVDSGPTVLTMRWVFDAMFAAAGARLEDHVALQPLAVLARHAWSSGAQLDLHADLHASADAIGAFAGARAAKSFLTFSAAAQRMHDTLLDTYLRASKPNPLQLAQRVGWRRVGDLLAIRPFDTLWRAICDHFKDARLRQLFARYATYCGSSPFRAPATLMLIAHVEQQGVWTVEGGMKRLADALVALAVAKGVTFRFGAEVARIETEHGRVCGVRLANGERLAAPTIVSNADPAHFHAVAPLRPRERSLSAITWSVRARTTGFPLTRHNVFFSGDYPTEFRQLDARNAPPSDPTIYVCAQDRRDDGDFADAERLLVLVNAPARGDTAPLTPREIDACEKTVMNRLARSGLTISDAQVTRTTPQDFDTLFPASGGALYGRATHGWTASFQRPGSRTKMPGLYLTGGGVHPGPGVPMAAISGRLAAQAILADRASTSSSRQAAMRGGISMPSATTNSTA
ncbi:MAG: phytoene desaturase [Hyphomonadaceae bacterium]|nr:phytoene desaturase [Hyphomonadaceae bacterium]